MRNRLFYHHHHHGSSMYVYILTFSVLQMVVNFVLHYMRVYIAFYILKMLFIKISCTERFDMSNRFYFGVSLRIRAGRLSEVACYTLALIFNMSDIGSCEDLSEDVIESLRVKGLLNFVVFEQSSNTAITLMVYDNEKYRPIVREWGAVVGIHIFPPMDRKPFTDDLGKHSIRFIFIPPYGCRNNFNLFYFTQQWTIIRDSANQRFQMGRKLECDD